MKALEVLAATAAMAAVGGYAVYVARDILTSPVQSAPVRPVLEVTPYDPRPGMWKMGTDVQGRYMVNLQRDANSERFTMYRPQTGFQTADYDGKAPTNLDASVEDLWELRESGSEPCFVKPIKVMSVPSETDGELVDLFWHMYWTPKDSKQPEPWLSKIMY